MCEIRLDSERLERVLNYGHNQGFFNVEDEVTVSLITENEVVYTVRVDNLILQESGQVDFESFLVSVEVFVGDKVVVFVGYRLGGIPVGAFEGLVRVDGELGVLVGCVVAFNVCVNGAAVIDEDVEGGHVCVPFSG